jgi:hypothetical protein
MSSYKRPKDIEEEARSGKPNPYLKNSWAWREYEYYLNNLKKDNK